MLVGTTFWNKGFAAHHDDPMSNGPPCAWSWLTKSTVDAGEVVVIFATARLIPSCQYFFATRFSAESFIAAWKHATLCLQIESPLKRPPSQRDGERG